jgi:hypothetical protein
MRPLVDGRNAAAVKVSDTFAGAPNVREGRCEIEMRT